MHDSPALLPHDEFNSTLAANVHPQDWQNPTPSGRYNLVVIGGGPAGLVSAIGAAGMGAKVALIERDLMGGDCLNVGCVPSKALIGAGRAVGAIRDAAEFGVTHDGKLNVDFASAMRRMRKLRSEISSHDSATRFRDAGIDVYMGNGRFTGRDTIEVAGQNLEFRKAVVATGARAAALPIDGLESAGALTNETVFSLTDLPESMIVIGGGPIGCELAQTFARLGSRVTLIEKSGAVLSREDREAAKVVQDSMRRDGVEFVFDAKTIAVARQDENRVVTVQRNGENRELSASEVLVAAGRAPNVDALNLEAAGIAYDQRRGIEVDDRMRTSNRSVFAAGDVASKFKFTHAADFQARAIIGNALFLGRSKASKLVIPWATYTAPELAQVGLTEEQAAETGVEIDTYTQHFSDIDRSILDGATEGFVRVHTVRGSDRIVGATIVGENAGDMIGELTLAMTHSIGLKKIASTIHPYPTRAEAIRKIGDQYNRTRLTPFVQSVIKRWLAWTR